MNREILFRGRDFNGKWYYGDLLSNAVIGNKTYIMTVLPKTTHFALIEIDPETVGQFTDQYDKPENKIFEDDIVKMWLVDSVEPDGGIWHHMFVKCTVEKGFVLWSENMTIEDATPLYQMLREFEIEVVGNVYDNPELLK